VDKSGGPAFPVDREHMEAPGYESRTVSDGMTLRQWYAGMALQGMLAACAHPNALGYEPPASAAKTACEYADALIAEDARTGG